MATANVSGDFDAQAILATVDAWHAPDSWTVYRAERKYFMTSGLAYLLLALMLSSIVILPVVLLIMYPTEIAIPWDEAGTYGILLLVAVWILFTAYFFINAVSLLAQFRSAEKQMIVLTPQGVVGRMGKQEFAAWRSSAVVYPTSAWDGARDGRIFVIPYEKLREVKLSIMNSKYGKSDHLLLTLATSSRVLQQVDWLIDERFAATDSIAQGIIEAHVRYTVLHEEAGD